MTARTRIAFAAAVLIGATTAAARPDGGGDQGAPVAMDERAATLTFDPPAAEPEGTPAGAEAATAPEGAARRSGPFGEQGASYVSAGMGLAYNFNDSEAAEVSAGYSIFLIKDVEFKVDVRFFYFIQEGDDAAGINPIMYFRWHYLDRDTWTLYSDLGIGLLFATDNVPDGGTGFDFTPTVGFGVTQLLDEQSGLRLDAGVRWLHVSNARIQGDVSNPSLDSLMVYAGVMLPFR